MPAPANPPYTAGTLHAPLTPVERQKMISYIKKGGFADKDIADYIGWPNTVPLSVYIATAGGSGTTVTDLDTMLISAYEAVAAGGGFQGNPKVQKEFQNPLPAIGQWFVDNIVRLGEIVVGVVIVGVAVGAMMKGRQ